MNDPLHSARPQAAEIVGAPGPHVCSCDLDHLITHELDRVRLHRNTKDLLFARTSGGDGLQVIVDARIAAWVIGAVLAAAVRNSPYRGIVTVDVTSSAIEVVMIVYDQGPPQGASEAHLHSATAFLEIMGGSLSTSANAPDLHACTLTFKRA